MGESEKKPEPESMPTQQEAANQRLLTEKTSLAEQLAFYNSVPQNVLTIYSNLTSLASNQPSQLKLLTEVFTNFIHSMEAERPRFEVSANGKMLKPITIVPLDESRAIRFSIVNASEVTADQLSVNFVAFIAGTNWTAEEWVTPGARGRMTDSGIELADIPHTFYTYIANRPVPAKSSFSTTSLILKTNFHTMRTINVSLDIYSSKSKTQRYEILLEIPPISE